MKKKIYFIYLFILLIPLKVNALTGSVNINCSKNSLYVGESTTCSISGYSSEEVSAISTQLSTQGNINVTNISKSSAWQGESGNKLDLYTESNKTGSFTLATFNVSATSVGNGTINLSPSTFVDANFNDNGVAGKSINISVKEKEVQKVVEETNNNTQNKVEEKKEDKIDVTLKTLNISNVKFNFKSSTYSYNIDVPYEVENLKIEAIANDKEAKVEIPSNTNLEVGKNKIIIKVTNKNNTKQEYTLNINRKEKILSKNSKLKSVVIKGYDLKFESNTYSYDIGTINQNKLDIDVVTEDQKSTYKIYGNESIGTNDTILIRVKSEADTTSDYIILVDNKNNSVKKEKIENKSSNNNSILYLIIASLIMLNMVSYIIILRFRINSKKMINF